MFDVKPGPRWPGMREEPREFGRCATAPKPDEDKLGTVLFEFNGQEGFLSTAAAEPVGVWPEERSLGLSASRVEGWVMGLPVVDGVADSGWRERHGSRVRLVVNVADSPEQREWVRLTAFGDFHAREVRKAA